jgi:hypothetical protein
MSYISKGSQIASAIMTIVTLTVTGAAIFAQGLTSYDTVRAPSFVATSTTDGLVMEGGGDINASSTTSDATFGGTVSSTRISFTSATGTDLYATTGRFDSVTSTGSISSNDTINGLLFLATTGTPALPSHSFIGMPSTGMSLDQANVRIIFSYGGNIRFTVANTSLDFGVPLRPTANNSVDIGTPDRSIRNFYASGTGMFGGGSAGKAMCWKADGKTLGYCSSVVGAGGDCTCD